MANLENPEVSDVAADVIGGLRKLQLGRNLRRAVNQMQNHVPEDNEKAVAEAIRLMTSRDPSLKGWMLIHVCDTAAVSNDSNDDDEHISVMSIGYMTPALFSAAVMCVLDALKNGADQMPDGESLN